MVGVGCQFPKGSKQSNQQERENGSKGMEESSLKSLIELHRPMVVSLLSLSH